MLSGEGAEPVRPGNLDRFAAGSTRTPDKMCIHTSRWPPVHRAQECGYIARKRISFASSPCPLRKLVNIPADMEVKNSTASSEQPAEKLAPCHSEGRVLPEESAVSWKQRRKQIPRFARFTVNGMTNGAFSGGYEACAVPLQNKMAAHSGRLQSRSLFDLYRGATVCAGSLR